MRRTLISLALLSLFGCAAAPQVGPRPEDDAQLIEPTEHPADPKFASVPRDLKDLGGIVPRWTLPGGPLVAMGPDRVFHLVHAQDELQALDKKNGARVWSAAVHAQPEARPVFVAGQVLVPTPTGLVSLSAADGTQTWAWAGLVEDLLVTAHSVFVLGVPEGSQGQLLELDPQTGASRWARACLATCELWHAADGAVLLAPVEGRLQRVEAGRVTRAVSGLKGVQGAELLGEDLLVVTATAVTRSSTEGPRFSTAFAHVRAARPVGPHLLVDRGDALVSLHPESGAQQWSIGLSADLQDRLRLGLAVHLPEGQTLVPTEDLFGAGPVYLLVRDDGTLRVVRYGLPHLQTILTDGPGVLYAGRDNFIFSATRRRGAPIRHYQTRGQDVQDQLQRLATPPSSPAQREDQRRTLRWLTRLGRPAYQQALFAKIAGADPEALYGLLGALDMGHAQDRAVARQALWRLSVSPPALDALRARRLGLTILPAPWPKDLWAHLLRQAPRWWAELPAAGSLVHRPGLETLLGRPADPVARAQAEFIEGLAALQVLADRALGEGQTAALWAALAPSLDAPRRNLPCPWPLALVSGDHPAGPRCPLAAPPPGASLSPDATVAVWKAGTLGHPDDLWVMFRRGARWGPALFTGLEAKGSVQLRAAGRDLEVVAGASAPQPLPPAAALSRDRDGDGLTDRVELRWGTDPNRADSDRDGRTDREDPSPSCAADPGPEAEMRGWLAQTVAGLDPRATTWVDGSKTCLSASLPQSPLLRASAQPALPAQSVLSVDTLEGEDKDRALGVARASGQLSTPPALTLVLRYGVRHGPLDGHGATIVFVLDQGQWRAIAWVDRWRA